MIDTCRVKYVSQWYVILKCLYLASMAIESHDQCSFGMPSTSTFIYPAGTLPDFFLIFHNFLISSKWLNIRTLFWTTICYASIANGERVSMYGPGKVICLAMIKRTRLSACYLRRSLICTIGSSQTFVYSHTSHLRLSLWYYLQGIQDLECKPRLGDTGDCFISK